MAVVPTSRCNVASHSVGSFDTRDVTTACQETNNQISATINMPEIKLTVHRIDSGAPEDERDPVGDMSKETLMKAQGCLAPQTCPVRGNLTSH